MRKKILVTGGNGQLAQSIRSISSQFPNQDLIIASSDELDITNKSKVEQVLDSLKIDWCINCAAYTAVDRAECEQELAYKINVKGVKILANSCKEHNAKLIHISTDFVFDGMDRKPYKENDQTNPKSVYGKTKLEGEKEIEQTLEEYFIIRTSWLYSEFKNNFLKTMLRLAKTKKSLSVVNDQIGCPTYAKDLAFFILRIVETNSNAYGMYHYCNSFEISWFDFAKTIFELTNTSIDLTPISTESYPTAAERPKYSVLDTTKSIKIFNVNIPFWKDSLIVALKNLE